MGGTCALTTDGSISCWVNAGIIDYGPVRGVPSGIFTQISSVIGNSALLENGLFSKGVSKNKIR